MHENLTLFAESPESIWRLADLGFRDGAEAKDDNTVETGDFEVCGRDGDAGGGKLFAVRIAGESEFDGGTEASNVVSGFEAKRFELDGNTEEARVLGTRIDVTEEEEGVEEADGLGTLGRKDEVNEGFKFWDLKEEDKEVEGRRRIGVLKTDVELGLVVENEIDGLEVEDEAIVGGGEEEGVDNDEGETSSNSGNEIGSSGPGRERGESEDEVKDDSSFTGAEINGRSVERSSTNVAIGTFFGVEGESFTSKVETDSKVVVDNSDDLKGLYFGWYVLIAVLPSIRLFTLFGLNTFLGRFVGTAKATTVKAKRNRAT
jgi:hypothetical protein